ncbi:MAG TPA: hypothetical protein VFE64_16870 [Devosia sp.]|nr:hypothetical protein [Devosia sp.]
MSVMALLDRIEDRRTQRLLHDLRHQAIAARDLAQDRLSELAHSAGGLAGRAAHDVSDYGQDVAHDALEYGRRAAGDLSHYARNDGAEHAREAARYYARRAGKVATQVADYGRQEGAILAQAAAQQAMRAGRAVKSDPVPVIVGAIGLALLANLLLGRRRD